MQVSHVGKAKKIATWCNRVMRELHNQRIYAPNFHVALSGKSRCASALLADHGRHQMGLSQNPTSLQILVATTSFR